ncbi:MAG: hypothetical protein WC763_02910 [Candidatus Paceibacterota bacterium]|jgi:hypothetical protein
MKPFLKKIHGWLDDVRGLGRNPAFDWHFSLGCFSFGLLLVIVLSTVIYFRLGYADVPIPPGSTSGGERAFNADSIQKTLKGIQQKREDAGSVPKAVVADPAN